jgi:hypothetical protein
MTAIHNGPQLVIQFGIFDIWNCLGFRYSILGFASPRRNTAPDKGL